MLRRLTAASHRCCRTVWVLVIAALVSALLLGGCAGTGRTNSSTSTPSSETTGTRVEPTVFAVIGDYGEAGDDTRAVADLVASWRPDYIVSLGDGYYAKAGGEGTGKYDISTGQYYGAWIARATPSTIGSAPDQPKQNAFFPVMGNHDYTDATPAPDTYLDYFALPGAGIENTSGNERYYDFVRGPVHFFALNSAPEEQDGITRESRQAQWLEEQLADSASPFDVVYVHRAPYSSDLNHGSTRVMRWPFAEWGADVVMSGHAHSYERIERDGIVYFVNGLGGSSERYLFRPIPVDGSRMRYRDNWGAQKVTVTDETMVFEFYAVDGTRVDSHTVEARR